jgi:predicted Zn-ribbon and HTH transcriptional regulator
MSTTGTIRQQIFDLLCRHTLDSRALSQQLSVAEKEVLTHLPHLARSAKSKGKRLIIHPANCQKCHFIFRDRSRFTKPGRCPRCKGTHLTPPLFSLR